DPVRIHGELECVCPFGTERAFADGAVRVTFDVDELAALGVDELAATDRAVGADPLGDLSAAQARALVDGAPAERFVAELVCALHRFVRSIGRISGPLPDLTFHRF